MVIVGLKVAVVRFLADLVGNKDAARGNEGWFKLNELNVVRLQTS